MYMGVMDLICWMDMWNKLLPQFVCACFFTIFIAYFHVNSLRFSLISVVYTAVVNMTGCPVIEVSSF
jgi:hypothetical protein